MNHKNKNLWFKDVQNRKLLYLVILMWVVSLILIDSSAGSLYNTTNITNARNIYDQAKALNNIVDGILGIGIILIVFTITFTIVSGNNDALAGLGAAGFISALTATILLPLQLIGFWVYQLTLLIAGISVFLSMVIRR